MAIVVTHSKTLVAPDSGAEDKVYGSDYVDPASHTVALGADDNFVTDAQLVVVGNTSGTNTGDASGHSTLVVGPASATDNAVAKFDGTTGKLLKDGVVLGTIATQNASAVAITGGTINGTTVGASTPAAITGTTITSTGAITGNAAAAHILGNIRFFSSIIYTASGLFYLCPSNVQAGNADLSITPISSQVNGMDILLSATGNAVKISTKGVDSNVSLAIMPKGTGKFGIGTTAPDKICEINLGTADAFRLTYNDANGSAATYMDTTLSSAGVTTFTGAGSAPAFNFAQAVITAATATGSAGLRLPHGTAPSAPVDGDIWTTTAGLFVRINGVTKTVTLT